jgi:hypothetical protein
MKNAKTQKRSLPFCAGRLIPAALLLFIALFIAVSFAAAQTAPSEGDDERAPAPGTVIVAPKFGGQILGYGLDPSGTEGVLSEFVNEANGSVLAATETFNQSTGQIVSVVGETETQDDYAVQGVFGKTAVIDFQHAGQNTFLTINPLEGNKFNGEWKPPIMDNYDLGGAAGDLTGGNVAAYQMSFDTGLTFVFSSNILKNTFGPQISLASIIDVDEFFQPLIALDSKTDQAVLASSNGCPEPICVMSVALVNLTTGDITEFNDKLGIGTVNGLAVDPTTGIACTTTLIDQGVEFYNLADETGFEVTIPNSGSSTDAGLSVAFDPIHSLFLVTQWSSNGGNTDNPEPRIYVYNEAGNVQETIDTIQRLPISPTPIALNPSKRIGFVPVVVEPEDEFLELQSFSY